MPVKKIDTKDSTSNTDNEKYEYKQDAYDELVYRDSSTFLKVNHCLINEKSINNEHFREHNHQTPTMITVNILWILVKDPKTSFEMWGLQIGLRSIPSSGN